MDEDEQDDSYLAFDTRFRKNGEEPSVLEWTVALRRYSTSSDEGSSPLASLVGFIIEPGYLPDSDDDGLFDVFDMRSQHAYNAFRVLVDDRPLIEKALEKRGSLDECAALAHLDRMWVDPSLRGRGIGLRLMREAQHVLGRYGLLVILKAHPNEEKVQKKEFLKFAKYYQSDKQLGLVPVSVTKRPGWLVGIWNEPVVHPEDAAFFYNDE